jgi:hypothetical protein
MLFLIALPVVGCVALFWRYLQIYAPSNVLIRRVRSAQPRWRTTGGLLVLALMLLVAMNVVDHAVQRGAPGWLNLVVLVLAWDAIKLVGLSILTAIRAATRGLAPARLRLKMSPQSTKGWAR